MAMALTTDLCTCGHVAGQHHLGDGIDTCDCQSCDVQGCNCQWYVKAKGQPKTIVEGGDEV